jgi:hypothetical protein
MGYNARNDEIRHNIERMRRDREAYVDELRTVRQFNTRLSAEKPAVLTERSLKLVPVGQSNRTIRRPAGATDRRRTAPDTSIKILSLLAAW